MSQISASILIDILIKYILIKKRVYSHFLCLHGNSSSTASDRERRFRPSPCQGAVRRRRCIRSKFYFFKKFALRIQFPSANEKFVFSIALQIKPSGSRGAGSAVAQFLVCNHMTRWPCWEVNTIKFLEDFS